MTIKQYADKISVSVHTVSSWIQKMDAPFTPSRGVVLDFDEIEKWRKTKLKRRGKPSKVEPKQTIKEV